MKHLTTGTTNLSAAPAEDELTLHRLTNALRAPLPPVPEGAEVFARQFADAFMSGEIIPFYEGLEDSTVLYDLLSSEPERYGQLASLTLKYAHQHHCTFAVALAGYLQAPDSLILVVDQHDAPLHSMLADATGDLLLDANGVRTQQDVLNHFKGTMLGLPVSLRKTTLPELIALGEVNQEAVDAVLPAFGVTAEFMLNNLVALHDGPEFDDELDDEPWMQP
ncbi:hypothetical protein DV532_27365 (plasmid) [Pseudomonas sp. Leaf58]|uniref:hypothetical protein n=1 Tax=Pseudomonas sp. Leaf58 TaxID=1736226 RepID=UPI00070215CB|nr:hypothetical protein [Pseudomonas sp. Leaf58]AYG48003.1 hypothetical protein DV532_27365 [Pseudomonas sp. Leaf58]KQN62438.1 hypothetical protein ASF02_09825 [Pseudomonas sp. Leaf58]